MLEVAPELKRVWHLCFRECCWTVLWATCYWRSSHCIFAYRFETLSAKLNHNRSP